MTQPRSEGAQRTVLVASPVNLAGSFIFDRIIKSGKALKRGKRTRSWKTVYLVLRPDLLSIYRDPDETQIRHQIHLSEITAVALRRDGKGKENRDGVFGIYTPARNFKLSSQEGKAWVSLIRQEARINGEEVILASPEGTQLPFIGSGRRIRPIDNIVGSSVNSGLTPPQPSFISGARRSISSTRPIPILSRHQPIDANDFSGNDAGSYSDFSDAPIFGSARDLSVDHASRPRVSFSPESVPKSTVMLGSSAASTGVNESPFYKLENAQNDEQRVIWHGYLDGRKTHGGITQWKRSWVVLRPKHLALYKNEEEYSAMLIISLSSVIDVVETDPVSKHKQFCFQVITDERSFRFCAADEDLLSNWIGRIKSALTRRRGRGLSF